MRHKISLCAQEPRFTPLDNEFLASLGVTVLNSPGSLEHIGDDSFIYVPSLEWSTETPYREKAVGSPLYITSDMEYVIDEAEREQRVSLREGLFESAVRSIKSAKAILDTHDKYKLPDFEHSDALRSLTIYVLKAAEDGGHDNDKLEVADRPDTTTT